MWLRMVNSFVCFAGVVCLFNYFVVLTGAESFGKCIRYEAFPRKF